MEFIDFIKSLSPQKNEPFRSFVEWASGQKDFPGSSHPVILASYLFDKLDGDMIHAYQKLYVFYQHADPDNKIPPEYQAHDKLVEAINIIVKMKNEAGHKPVAGPSKKLSAKRPAEYICFFPCCIPTEKDGELFVYIFVDAHSGFIIMTGAERNDGDLNILKHIRLLLENKDFMLHRGRPFTLVMHKYDHLIAPVNFFLQPFGGKAIINNHYVTEIVRPVIEELFKRLADKD